MFNIYILFVLMLVNEEEKICDRSPPRAREVRQAAAKPNKRREREREYICPFTRDSEYKSTHRHTESHTHFLPILLHIEESKIASEFEFT